MTIGLESILEGSAEQNAVEPTGDETVQGSDEQTGATPGAALGSDSRTVPLKALEDERHKRQQYQRDLEETRLRLERLQGQVDSINASRQQPNQPQEERWDPEKIIDDPAGFQKHIEDKLESRVIRERVEASREMAYSMFDDADAVLGKANEAFAAVPGLQERVSQSRSPFVMAYREIKKWDEQRSKLSQTSELEKQVQDLQAQLEAMKSGKPVASIPQPVHLARGAGGTTKQAPAADIQELSLEQILA